MIQFGMTDHEPFMIDMDNLFASRTLVQASSGAGKSYLLRRLAEIAGKRKELQVIIFDLEGEYYTLAAHLDMLVVSADSEIKPDEKMAGLLARSVMEDRVSTILDLSELDIEDQRDFVAKFLKSMLGLAKSFWQPTFVIIDEAHLLCTEQGKGRASSTAAVTSFTSRCRKRGWGVVLATQRIAKISKDAISDCKTMMFGGTAFLDDQKRSAESLGMKDTKPSMFSRLKVGEFYAIGQALPKAERIKFKVDETVTKPPQPGKANITKPRAPSRTIQKVIRGMTELSRSEDQPLTLEAATQTIAELKKKIKQGEKTAPAPAPKQDVIDRAVSRAVNLVVTKQQREFKKLLRQYDMTLGGYDKKMELIGEIVSRNGLQPPTEADVAKHFIAFDATAINDTHNHSAIAEDLQPKLIGGITGWKKTPGYTRMLMSLVDRFPAKFSESDWAIMSNMSRKGGTFGNHKSKLRLAGLIAFDGKIVQATQKAVDEHGNPDTHVKTLSEVIEGWKLSLGGGPSRILDVLLYGDGGNWTTRKHIGEILGVVITGGTFGNNLSKLRTNGLIEEQSGGRIRAAGIIRGES